MKSIYTLLAIGVICLLPVMLVADDCGCSVPEAKATSGMMDCYKATVMPDESIPNKLTVSPADEGIVGIPAEAKEDKLTISPADEGIVGVPAEAKGDKLTISLTDEGIVGIPAEAKGGLYVVTIVNDASTPRGVVLKGIDLGPTPYVRYTKVLEPGHQETFRWYFPEDKNVNIRDLISCTHEQRTCMAAREGNLNSSINFL